MVLTQFHYPIQAKRTQQSRLSEVDLTKVGFGSVVSDHQFVAELHDGSWQPAHIEPYQATPEGPAMSALNYGQSIFEGMKAFRNQAGKVQMFRPQDHWQRLNRSAARMAMPEVPENLFMAGLSELLRVDAAWVPSHEGSSLYLRPLYFATDEFIGVRPSLSYRFVVITSPGNRYYAKPIKALAETEYIRAAQGGVGEAKCAGNYGLSMLAGRKAKEQGYDVVVWLDAHDRKLVEEFSTMNAFFVMDGVLVTPRLRGTFLRGITRDSIITLAHDNGMDVQERDITIDEVIAAGKSGKLTEAFGTGTAATVAPVATIAYRNESIQLPPVESWTVANLLRKQLDDIRYGLAPDQHNWMYPVN